MTFRDNFLVIPMLSWDGSGRVIVFSLVHSTSLESKSFSELRVQLTTATSPYLAWTTLGEHDVLRSEMKCQVNF